MTWFDIVKRGAKINREYFKEFLQREINKGGYVVLGIGTIDDVFNDYKDFLREKQEQVITSAEQRKFSDMIATISRNIRYSRMRFVSLANNIASQMFRIKITKTSPTEGDLKGLKTEIVRNGSIYFKNMDARNEYVDKVRKVVYKRRYIDRTYK